jgi:hypothetical protein
VLTNEVSPVLEEPVGDEDRNVVHPRVSGRSGQQDPGVVLHDLEERLDPFSATNQSLLVEDEDGTLNVRVLVQIVPRIDRENTADRFVGVLTYRHSGKLFLPVLAISLTRRGDDVDVLVRMVLQVVVNRHPRFTRPYATTQNVAVTELP